MKLNKIILIIFVLLSCSCQKKQDVLNQDDVYVVDSIRTNKIYYHRNMSLVDSSHYREIIKSIKIGIDTTSKTIDVQDVEVRVLVFPSKTIPRIGMSGAAPDTKHIYILLDPAHPKFDEAITTHIVQTIPHEYHHTLRYRAIGYNNSLLESMITEGLACHFAIEACKIDTPFYCKALSEEQYREWKSKAEKIWFDKEYDYMEWFVGLKNTIPPNTGYTIGFILVSDYLKKHPGETAATLYKTPASKFLEKISY